MTDSSNPTREPEEPIAVTVDRMRHELEDLAGETAALAAIKATLQTARQQALDADAPTASSAANLILRAIRQIERDAGELETEIVMLERSIASDQAMIDLAAADRAAYEQVLAAARELSPAFQRDLCSELFETRSGI